MKTLRANKLLGKIIIASLTFLLVNCATYTITNSSLQEQLRESIPTEGTFSYTTGGLFLFRKMMYNGVRQLVVNDKNGKERTIKVTNRTGIRITKKDGKRKTFYFDTMFLTNGQIVGQKTHFIPSPIKPIPFEDVIKIEIR